MAKLCSVSLATIRGWGLISPTTRMRQRECALKWRDTGIYSFFCCLNFPLLSLTITSSSQSLQQNKSKNNDAKEPESTIRLSHDQAKMRAMPNEITWALGVKVRLAPGACITVTPCLALIEWQVMNNQMGQ